MAEPATIVGAINGRRFEDVNERRTIRVGGAPVVLEVSCRAGRDRPRGLYTLSMKAFYERREDMELETDADGLQDGDMPPARIFVYHRHASAWKEGWPGDDYVCMADALDIDEIPPDCASSEEAEAVPFYRTASLELGFRSSDMMYECRDAMYAMGS